MFLAAFVFGVRISVGAVLLEDVFFRRYRKLSELLWLLTIGVLENFGYRQVTTWWRVRGWIDYFRNKKNWISLPRKGFARA